MTYFGCFVTVHPSMFYLIYLSTCIYFYNHTHVHLISTVFSFLTVAAAQCERNVSEEAVFNEEWTFLDARLIYWLISLSSLGAAIILHAINFVITCTPMILGRRGLETTERINMYIVPHNRSHWLVTCNCSWTGQGTTFPHGAISSNTRRLCVQICDVSQTSLNHFSSMNCKGSSSFIN